MKLTVDREDLKPEHKDVNCSMTKFEHFLPGVQEAIKTVGYAVFWEYDNSSYNRINSSYNRINYV